MRFATVGAGVGAGSGVLLAVLVVLPYTLGSPAAVGIYYAQGPIGPPVAAVFALIASLVLVAAYRGRTDPAWAAGTAVVLAGVVTLFVFLWSIAVTPDLVGGFTAIDAARYHRHLVVLSGLGIFVGSATYARAVLRS